MIELGRTIRMLREAKAVGLGVIAEHAKVSVPFLSLVERGERQPSLDVLRRISAALAVPSEVLILLAMPDEEGLKAGSKSAGDLVQSIKKLAEAEDLLRAKLQECDRKK